jgi:predicted O-methyltransferase YrrM
MAELIEVKIGDAKEIIPTLKESFDLIFQDVGDKTLYPVLLNNLITRWGIIGRRLSFTCYRHEFIRIEKL